MRRGVFLCLNMLGFVSNGEGVDILYLLFLKLFNPYVLILGGGINLCLSRVGEWEN